MQKLLQQLDLMIEDRLQCISVILDLVGDEI